MSAADLLEDGFPHGTVDGHLQGCKTAHCPAPISCTDMKRRYASDWGFRRRVDAGWTVEAIMAAEVADEVAARAVEKAAKAAAAKAAREASAPPRAVAAERAARRGFNAWTDDEIARLRELHAGGKTDGAIGIDIGRPTSSVQSKRKDLELPRVKQPRGPRSHGNLTGYQDGCHGDDCPVTPSCGEVGRKYNRERSARRYAEKKARKAA